MSDPIFGVLAKKWVAQCLHRYLPKNYTGVFKIYWKNVLQHNVDLITNFDVKSELHDRIFND